MNAAYKRHAYARSILAELRRHLVDKFTSADGTPKATLICEEVFFVDRFVPSDHLHDMIDRLRQLEEQERLQMADSMQRPPAAQPTSKEEVSSESKGPERRKRKAAEA